MFMVKGPLMFVAVSQGPEYQQQIIQQMTYAYNQILSVLTFTQLQTVFQRKPNFDLRFLLQGNRGDILKMIYSNYIKSYVQGHDKHLWQIILRDYRQLFTVHLIGSKNSF